IGTLLNALFGTNFSVMNTSGRQQTTKGIWMGKCTGHNILVMDVEGVDGQERGDDKTVERRSALFSLAIADVLVINMPETMINLQNGANVDLLRTVFEAHLRLFKNSENRKTQLLFVIRDYTKRVSLDSHQSSFQKTMDGIWSGISKPQDMESSHFADFFSCTFVALSPEPFQAVEFYDEVDQLRSRFTDKSNDSYMFRLHSRPCAPADALKDYMSSIWNAILADRDLDMPSQQRLLAEYRCREAYAIAESNFGVEMDDIAAEVDGGEIVDDLGAQMKRIFDNALDTFDAKVKHYDAEIYLQKREDLEKEICKRLKYIVLKQLDALFFQSLDTFEEKL
ncbi:RHD3/Sey1, partial [Thamnocephalis sphaerospora]